MGGAFLLSVTGRREVALSGSRSQMPAPCIDNVAGIRLQTPIRVNATLDLQNGVLTSSSTNLLTLAAAAPVTGGNSRSYVSGSVARQLPAATTSAQLFPVGKSGNYRPVVLQPSQLDREAVVSVEQQEGPPAPLAFNDALRRVSRVRRFAISAAPALAATQFTGVVTLTFGPDDQVNDPAAASLVVARTDGTGWNSLGRSTNTGPTDSPSDPFVAGTLTSASFSGLGDFQTYTLASTNPETTINPLPVQLVEFGAERRAGDVALRWATVTELNSASFEVQRSAAGQNFQTIATVAAQGSSNTRHDYAVLDRQPLPGISYYRLRQLDLDGRQAYSAVVSVAAPGEVRVYPNPVQDRLTLQLPAAGARYRIISSVGRVVLAGELPGGTAELDVGALPAGLYQLEITTPTGHDMRKIIKQ